MKILFLPKYTEKGASSRYRSYNYKKYFLEQGIEVYYSPFFNDSYLKYLYNKNNFMRYATYLLCLINRIFFILKNYRKYDKVVIEKELFPNLPLYFDKFFIKKFKSFSLDYDDNIHANYVNTSIANKIPELIKMAKFVTIGNHWYESEFKGNLIYLPTVIDLDKYPKYNLQEESQDLEIIWLGSPYTVKYLLLIEKVLIKLSEKYDFTLKIIGGKIDIDNKIKTKFVKWSSDTENIEMAKSSIGIMPLQYDYFELGKCGFKLIQYMASGIPVVASPLPANKDIVTENVGYIADTEKEWYEKLSLLLENFELRKKMGREGRKRVEEHYSYQIWGEKYVEILKK